MPSRGKTKWKCSLPMSVNSHNIGSSTAVVSTSDHSTEEITETELGVDLSTGEILWNFTSDTDLLHPFVFTETEIAQENIVVFAEMFGGKIFLRDIRRGKTIWERQVTNNRLMKILNNRLLIRNIISDVVYGREKLYISITSRRYTTDDYTTIKILDARNGKKTSEFSFEGFGSGMCYYNQCLHLDTEDDFRVYDPEGNIQYKRNHSKSGAQGITVNNGIMYGKSRSSIWARNLDDGRKLWELNNKFNYINHGHRTQISDDYLFITEKDNNEEYYLYCIDSQDGTVVWGKKVTTNDTRLSAPCLYRTTVFTATNDGELYAHNANSGNLEWDKKLTNETNKFVVQPIVHDANLFVGLGRDYHCVSLEKFDNSPMGYSEDSEALSSTDDKYIDLAIIPGTKTAEVGEEVEFEIRTENGIRVEGATVSSGSKSYTTGSQGLASISFDSPGEYIIEVSKRDDTNNYGTDNVKIYVQ